MKLERHRHLLAAVLLVAGSATLLAGCMGMGGTSSSTTSSQLQARVATTAQSVADASQESLVVVPADAYSNFQTKDPFVQQQVTQSTQAPANPPYTPATTPPATTPPTTTPPTTTPPTTTPPTTTPPTTTPPTTLYSRYMVWVRTVAVVGGAPAVTFQVDRLDTDTNHVYQDKREGEWVDTSWGKVNVVDIDMVSTPRQVTLLHDNRFYTMYETESRIFE